MAVILLSDTTVTRGVEGNLKTLKIVTAATADAGDAIDVSSEFDNGCFSVVSSSATLAPTLAADKYGDKSVTLPAGATNEAHTIHCRGD